MEDRPYTRTPRVLASGDWDLGSGAIDYGFDAELVNFERNVGVTGWRMDVAPRVGLDWSAPGFFVRPSGGFRYTQYSLEDNDPGTDDSPTRSLPFASLDAGLVFERTAGSRGQRRMTLEPRALYLYAPFREQSELPLFDTGLPDLNLVQLFRANRYVGADRVNDANQVSFGLTSPPLRRRHGRAIPGRQLRPGLLLRETARRACRMSRWRRATPRTSSRRFRCPPTRTGTWKPACNGIPKTRAASAHSSACNTGRPAIRC